MWDALKFVILLVLITVVIVTIDQYAKKRPRRLLWAGTAFLTCIACGILFLANPSDLTSLSSGGNYTSQGPSGAAESTAGETSGSTAKTSDNSGTVSKGANQAQNATQNNGQSSGPGSGQNGAPPGETPDKQQGSGQSTVIQPDLLLPVDEANLDAGFQEFRDNFLAAVQRKDLAFLKDHLSPDLRYSFGINNGVNGFLHEWQLDTKPGQSQVWEKLDQVLSLGGSFDEKKAVFTAPYVFSKFPPGFDSFENVAVIRQNVSIHQAPNAASPVIIGLSYKILKLADTKSYKTTGTVESGDVTTWRKVETSAGPGFINAEYVRSPVDYRAQFRQENGVWKMMFFVAGD